MSSRVKYGNQIDEKQTEKETEKECDKKEIKRLREIKRD